MVTVAGLIDPDQLRGEPQPPPPATATPACGPLSHGTTLPLRTAAVHLDEHAARELFAFVGADLDAAHAGHAPTGVKEPISG